MALEDEEALLQYHMERMQMGLNPSPYVRDPRRAPQHPIYKDFVTIENPPNKVKNNHTITVSNM